MLHPRVCEVTDRQKEPAAPAQDRLPQRSLFSIENRDTYRQTRSTIRGEYHAFQMSNTMIHFIIVVHFERSIYDLIKVKEKILLTNIFHHSFV